ncbi:hypothetical protein B0A48_12322 [Cryoendolithus antarcticus]|uniref:Uncharacterized protein n=1 Tax=Cryoendolithus antarcticus TaxID=1507870 RepID=A0A1V8SS06_9PEZI|nr:hypothetical protein B0A48_12322 [Cryoendolithus antarcticus]
MAFNAASLPRFSTTSTAPDPLQDVPFRFGHLLPELRDYVYDFYFANGDTKGSLIDLASIAEKRPSLSLTLVCRQAHDESFPTLLPDPTSFTCEPYWSFPDDCEATFQENYVQPEPRTQHTILGDFESDSFEISNVTTLWRFVNRLHRLQLGYSPGQCQTTLVAWEALDQEDAKQSSDSKLYDRSGLTGDADSDCSTGSEQVGRVSEQGMLQSLTKFLRDESQERSSEMCDVTCAYDSEIPGDVASHAHFCFADLIPELRNNVYDFYFADDEAADSMIDLSEGQSKRPSLNLMLACRQTHDECPSRWQTTDDKFWRTHRFWLGESIIPEPGAH